MLVISVYPQGLFSKIGAFGLRVNGSVASAKKAAGELAGSSLRAEAVVAERRDDGALVRRWRGNMATGSWRWRDTTPDAAKPVGRCPVCGGSHPLTARGTLAPHRRSDGVVVRDLKGARRAAPCDGAGARP